jgi:hypothetical protein
VLRVLGGVIVMADRWSVAERVWAAAATAAVVGASLLPLRQYRRPRAERVDGFPMSYYPMFSAKRARFARISYALGVRADGSPINLPHDVLGPGGVNQVRKQLSRAVRRDEVAEHARRIAARVPEFAEYADVVRVRIVTGEFDLDNCLMARRSEGTETTLAEADVVRSAPAAEQPGAGAA